MDISKIELLNLGEKPFILKELDGVFSTHKTSNMEKQTFTIPEGCSATIEQLGDKIVIAFEPKKVEFKGGDIVVITGNNTWIAIYKSGDLDKMAYYAAFRFDNSKVVLNSFFNCMTSMRIACQEERQAIIDKLKESDYYFNPEKCELERIKWVPKEGEMYHMITNQGKINSIYNSGPSDDVRIELGNCFKPNSLDPEKVKKLYSEFIEKVKKEHNINY